jgi:hypothetical protein
MFVVQLQPSDIDALATAGELMPGAVWAVVAGRDFPAAGWTDLPVSVLSSAVGALHELHNGAPDAFSYFFDGPHYLYYRPCPDDPGAVRVDAVSDDGTPTALASTRLRWDELRDALARTIDSLLADLADRDHDGAAVSALTARASLLRRWRGTPTGRQ